MARTLCLLVLGLLLVAGGAVAQGASVGFGGLKQDPTQPISIVSDSLSVNQSDGTAIFTGDVLATQGDLRLAAAELTVRYAKDSQDIETINATGGVTLTSPTEAAEAKEAVYTVGTGSVVMTGDVLLTQGQNAISGQKLVLDVTTGLGTMEGRVQTVLTPAKKPEGAARP